ncbi:hypothetical protein G6F61_014009 [Rhizopus arrhizus]|nr:hypothetical protein G6F61_014009 [Rhizopus arrhizus]
MGQRPAWQRVGGEALVDHDGAGGQFAALQVRVEAAELVRQHHALVADRIRGERGDVEVGMRAQLLFAATARQEQRQREAGVVLADAGVDEHLRCRRWAPHASRPPCSPRPPPAPAAGRAWLRLP